MPGRRYGTLVPKAALLLLAFSFVAVAAAFEHTDDGCDVEVHCLPCQWHHGATVVFAVVPQPTAPVDLGCACDETEPRPHPGGARKDAPSRAPPLA